MPGLRAPTRERCALVAASDAVGESEPGTGALSPLVVVVVVEGVSKGRGGVAGIYASVSVRLRAYTEERGTGGGEKDARI